MADIGSITQGASYKGTPELGGGIGVGITIDPTPIARMAMFSYYRDQHLWEQKQKDDAVAARQIADISAYDITSPLTQYSKELKTGLDDLQKYVRENPESLVYGRSPEKFQIREEKINKFNTLRQTATASDTIWNKINAEIQKESDLQKRSVLQKKLDFRVKQLFEKGVDPNKILNDISEIKPSNYKVPKVAISTVDEFFVDANGNITSQIKKLDLLKLRSDSALEIARGRGTETDESSPEFKLLTEDEKDIARDEAKLTGRERQNIANLSTSLSNLIQQYKQLHPDASLKDIVGDPSGDNTLKDIIKSVNATNEQIRSYNQFVLSGRVQDPTKKVLRQTNDEINLEDGLSEEEIVMMQAIQENGNAIIIEVKKTSQPTGDALQARGLSIQEYNARTNRMQEDRLKSEGSGGGDGSNSLLEGNALNDIEIDENAELGEYVMGKSGNKQNIANIQRLLGTIKDKDGKDIPILSKKQIESQLENEQISYEIENIDGKRFVTKIKVNNVWYDRGYFRNSQLNIDHEPKGGQKTSYKQFQQYKGGKQAKPKTTTVNTKSKWDKYAE